MVCLPLFHPFWGSFQEDVSSRRSPFPFSGISFSPPMCPFLNQKINEINTHLHPFGSVWKWCIAPAIWVGKYPLYSLANGKSPLYSLVISPVVGNIREISIGFGGTPLSDPAEQRTSRAAAADAGAALPPPPGKGLPDVRNVRFGFCSNFVELKY